MPGAIKSPEMSPEERQQWREENRQVAQQCIKELGAECITVAIEEEEWAMPTEECPNGHEYKPGESGRACKKCRTIGIFECDGNLLTKHTAYHETLHILLLEEEHDWLIELCATLLMNVEIESEQPLTEGVDASIIKQWCEFVNVDPFPSRETLISIIHEKISK